MSSRKEKLTLLRCLEDGTAFSWQSVGTIWAAVEMREKSNLFSKAGLGARSVKIITVPHPTLSLHDALLWGGKHLFLTSITLRTPVRAELAAALLEPVSCTAQRAKKTRDGRGRPNYAPAPLCSFPGCLTEKYLGFVQKEPQGEAEHGMILVTPKAVVLQIGDLVTVGPTEAFSVRVCYQSDEYKNEYEIYDTQEA